MRNPYAMENSAHALALATSELSVLGNYCCSKGLLQYNRIRLIQIWLIQIAGSDQDFSPDKPLLCQTINTIIKGLETSASRAICPILYNVHSWI